MSALIDFLIWIFSMAVSVAAMVLCIAWVTVMPTIGLLWVLGWLA